MIKSVFNDSKISMRIVKRIVLIIFAVAVFCAAIACTPKRHDDIVQEYESTLYDKVQEHMTEEALIANTIREMGSDDDTYPYDITRVIRSQDEFDGMFKDRIFEADFETEVVVVYFFTDIYNGFDCYLGNVKLEENILNIEIRHKMPGLRYDGRPLMATSAPTVRAFAVKVLLRDFDDAQANVKYDDNNFISEWR